MYGLLLHPFGAYSTQRHRYKYLVGTVCINIQAIQYCCHVVSFIKRRYDGKRPFFSCGPEKLRLVELP